MGLLEPLYLNTFFDLTRPRSKALKISMMEIWRRQRMALFVNMMKPRSGFRILDIGGLPDSSEVPGLWRDLDETYQITLLNLPGAFSGFSARQLARYTIVEADACGHPTFASDFDIAFSNSVIEHVGSWRKRQAFAELVRSVAPNYWVQTPNPLFPVEAHSHVLFWWQLSRGRRTRIMREWRRRGDYRAVQMLETRPISSSALGLLFPGCALHTERFLGLNKSLIAYSR